MAGLIHLYCGDGKGKTTAAVGLAVRAAGAGKRVLFTQFFKNGSSSEIGVLRSLPGVTVDVCETYYGLYKYLSDEPIVLFLDERVSEEQTEGVKQLRQARLIDGFLYASNSMEYLVDTLESL